MVVKSFILVTKLFVVDSSAVTCTHWPSAIPSTMAIKINRVSLFLPLSIGPQVTQILQGHFWIVFQIAFLQSLPHKMGKFET
jgi:hypothetical protein